MASSDSDKVALAKVSTPDLAPEKMQEQQSQFAAEALIWLLGFSEVQPESSKPMPQSDDFEFFTCDVGKAVVMLSYIFRPSYRKHFQRVIRQVKSAEMFETYVMAYRVVKNDTYFYNFLTQVGFVFDFTMYCFAENMDFIELAVQCLSKYPDVHYFHSKGGWVELHKISAEVGKIYDTLSPVVSLELPTQKILAPFFYSVQMIVESNRFIGNRWLLVTPEMRLIRKIRNNLLEHYDLASNLDSSCVTGRFKTIERKSPKTSPQKSTPKTSPQTSPETAQLKSFSKSDRQSLEHAKGTPLQCEKDTKDFKKSLVSQEASKLGSGMDKNKNVASDESIKIDESKSVFIISKQFLEKRKAALKEHEIFDCMDDLKICSPSKHRELTRNDLYKIVDKNIENGNYTDIGNGAYSVCPPGCDIDNSANALVVLDTSYEEEEGSTTISGDKTNLQLDEVFRMILETRLEQEQLAAIPRLRKPSEESESVSEQHKFVLSSDTGAIPKTKSVTPKPEITDKGEAKSSSFDSVKNV